METIDPRFFPGNISGLGMTSDESGRKVDTRYGVLADRTDSCLIAHPAPGDITVAYAIDGRLDGTLDRVRGLYLLSLPMAAQVVTDLVGLLARADRAATTALLHNLEERFAPPPPVASAIAPEEQLPPPPEAPGPADTMVMPAEPDEPDGRAAA